MSDAGEGHRRQPFLYETVRNDIISMIRSRGMSAHDPIPSEGSIADTYNVSRMTGKLALKSLEEAGIIYRVQRKGSYLAEGFLGRIADLESESGKSFEVRGHQLSVALVVPGLDSYVDDIIRSINAEADAQGIRVLLRITDDEPAREDRMLAELAQLPYIQGIILFPSEREDCGAELLRLKLDRYPIVLIDRTYSDLTFDSVTHAHYDGAHGATSCLIEKGHREIGFISGPLKTSRSREQRYQGYLHALIEHAVSVRKEHIRVVESDIHTHEGTHVLDCPALEHLEAYLRNNPQLTAAFCTEDYIAIQVYYAATRLGLRVPEDLSIIGFTDNRALRFLPARISTVRQPVEEMGRIAVELLARRLANPESVYREVEIATEIVDRGSIRDLR